MKFVMISSGGNKMKITPNLETFKGFLGVIHGKMLELLHLLEEPLNK